MYYLLNIIKQH